MIQAVSITSQGQISITAKMRRKLGLGKGKNALVSIENGKIIIEPIKHLLELSGSLKTSKKVSSRTIRKAFEKYIASDTIR